jgi:hypothetical protein
MQINQFIARRDQLTLVEIEAFGQIFAQDASSPDAEFSRLL